MKNILVKFKSGGSCVIRNVFSIKYLGDEVHYFVCDMDAAVNRVTVVNEDNVFIREYTTQSFNAI
jgi:hypothetical protein